MGNPFLNQTVEGFLKIGTVAAVRFAAEEAYLGLRTGNFSGYNFENSLKRMCREGAYWGSIAGVYVGVEYGMERIRGSSDWKNAALGGALTGALLSTASNNNKDRIVVDALTGCAIATAAKFLSDLTVT